MAVVLFDASFNESSTTTIFQPLLFIGHGNSISKEDLDTARDFLHQFYKQFSELYGNFSLYNTSEQ